MGMDIHMNITREGEFVARDIFDGRNREWFNNLQGDGWDDVYDELPRMYGFSDEAPAELSQRYKKEDGYFGFYHVNVADFKVWFEKYRPDKDAGWVSTYDKWRIENKGYIPEDMMHYIPEDARIEDLHFVEVVNKYDCSNWLYNYLIDHNIPGDAEIEYCFDC